LKVLCCSETKEHPHTAASCEALPTAESLRANPNFAGTKQILSYTVYIIRQIHKRSRERGIETSTMLLNSAGQPLKTVRYSGGKAFVVYEPVRVTFWEPEAALMKAPADY
jgi:hypothetical protein